MLLSAVLPIHNERDNLGPVLAELEQALASRPHEIVAVDDASTDGSLDVLRELQRALPQLRVVSLAQRAGQSAALAAGWDAARGELVVTMDADGQNDPADIGPMLERLAREPAAVAVVGYRRRRADSAFRQWQSLIANAVRNWIVRDGIRDTGCSLKVMRREALLRLPRFTGMHRFLPALLQKAGPVIEAEVRHRPRLRGVSKYGMADRAWRGLVDAVGVGWLRHRALRYQVKGETGKS